MRCPRPGAPCLPVPHAMASAAAGLPPSVLDSFRDAASSNDRVALLRAFHDHEARLSCLFLDPPDDVTNATVEQALKDASRERLVLNGVR